MVKVRKNQTEQERETEETPADEWTTDNRDVGRRKGDKNDSNLIRTMTKMKDPMEFNNKNKR